jgi:hypothetical protein
MRLVCDAMLGKLARYLRMLGLDAAYAPSRAALERIGKIDPDRLLLTRRRSGGPSGFARTVRIDSEIAREQLREVKALIAPYLSRETVFSRCIECNVVLADVDKEDVEPSVPEFVYHNYTRFKTCPSCGRVYWEGSHSAGMAALIEEMFA